MQANQTTAEPVRYGLRQAIETIKKAVPIEKVAAEHGKFKLLGSGRLLGRCVAPDHEDRTPSLTIFTDTQRFKCFGCSLGGDVLDLEEIGGHHADTWTAVVALAERYSVELPQRPPEWFDWQDEKSKRRRMICEALADSYQRRYFRVFGGHLSDIANPEEYEREAAAFFDGLRRVAKAAARNRMSR